jgi:hypothetical protein
MARVGARFPEDVLAEKKHFATHKAAQKEGGPPLPEGRQGGEARLHRGADGRSAHHLRQRCPLGPSVLVDTGVNHDARLVRCLVVR